MTVKPQCCVCFCIVRVFYISRKISNIDKSAWVTWGFWFSIEALRRTQRYVVPGGPNRQLARSRCSLLPRCLSCMERSLSNLAILQQRQEQRSNCNTMHPMSSPATCLLGVELQFHAGLLASTSSSTQLRTAESRCGACSRSLFSSQKMSEWLVACGAVQFQANFAQGHALKFTPAESPHPKSPKPQSQQLISGLCHHSFRLSC